MLEGLHLDDMGLNGELDGPDALDDTHGSHCQLINGE